MDLSPGSYIGAYEITGTLGAGGMGEVYRARDTRLKRQVALKVLPESFASDPDRLARFQREAEVLASLNHPNIAGIYGLEQEGSTGALVLELVEGDNLADRITRGPIPIDEALSIALQISEALEAAHERGIIHRDLKPANIKLTPDGLVKVLDFGLAKAMDTSPAAGVMSHSPTLSVAATQAGVILGTAAYMSPEQAKGFAVDARSDVFSFGSVFYEMLTGRRAFEGETVADVLASVLAREADLGALSPGLNPRVHELLERCFEKNPKKRWQAVGDLRAELERISVTPRVSVSPLSGLQPPAPLWRRTVPLVATALLFIAVGGAAAWLMKPASSNPTTRFSLVLPEGQNFTRTRSQVSAISRDGTTIAYVANGRLHLRRLNDFAVQVIQGPDDVGSPFFSPDGRSIGYFSFQDAVIKRVAITGGAEVTICAGCATTLAGGVSWDGDTIVFAREAGREIVAVPPSGGTPEVIVEAGAEEVLSSPQLLPGGRVMFSAVAAGSSWDTANTVVLSPDSGERTIVLRGGSGARYLSAGHLAYRAATTLYVVPFDVDALRVTGEAVPVADGLMRSMAADYGPGNFDVSDNGTLIYATGDSGSPVTELAVSDITGNVTPIANLPAEVYFAPRASPDGKFVAVEMTDEGSIWIHELSGTSQLRRLTFEGVSASPVWSPDGRRVAFRSVRDGAPGMFVQNADGTGTAERITVTRTGQDYPFGWSPDGAEMLMTRENVLWRIPMSGDRQPTRFTEGPSGGQATYGGQLNAAFSPNGRWVAYASNEARPGGYRIYVQQFPSGAKYQVSRELANAPAWSRDGRELFYYQSESRRLVSVSIQFTPTFAVGEPQPVDVELFQPEGMTRQYDVLPDGRLLILRPAPAVSGEEPPRQQIHVVLNWFDELKLQAPAP